MQYDEVMIVLKKTKIAKVQEDLKRIREEFRDAVSWPQAVLKIEKCKQLLEDISNSHNVWRVTMLAESSILFIEISLELARTKYEYTGQLTEEEKALFNAVQKARISHFVAR